MKTYQQKGNNSLLILNHKTSKKVLIKEVILLKGDINYTMLYLENGVKKLVAIPSNSLSHISKRTVF